METIAYDELKEFFGLDLARLNSELRVRKVVEQLVPSGRGFEGIMPDAKPFLMLEQAAIFEDSDGKECIVSVGEVTPEQCEGHLPNAPMIPVIRLLQIVALTGRLLSAYGTQRYRIIAEVTHYGEGESPITLAEFKNLRPPQKIVSLARISQKDKREVRTTDNKAWIVIPEGFIPATTVNGVTYAIIPARIHDKALKSG